MSRSICPACLVAVIAVSVAVPLPAQQGAPLPGAPPLGGEKYSIHAAGVLKDIIQQLMKLTGRQIYLQGGPPPAGGEPVDKGNAPVGLNLDNATLDQIMAEVCKQAGVVYEVQPGGWGGQGAPISLRPGDPTLDSRPTVEAGDYLLRVVTVSIQSGRNLNFRWGEAAPAPAQVYKSTQIRVEATAKTVDASRALAGINSKVKGLPDKGDPMEVGGQGPTGYIMPFWDYGGDRSGMSRQTSINLPAPPEGATKLTRLEGNLMLYSTVKVTEVRVSPDSEGQVFKQDDVTATVTSWKLDQGNLQVGMTIQAPALPVPDNTPRYGNLGPVAALVTKDGKEMRAMGSGGGGPDTWKVTYNFRMTAPPPPGPRAANQPVPPEPVEIDYLRVTLVRTGAADKTLPFVFTDLPLP